MKWSERIPSEISFQSSGVETGACASARVKYAPTAGRTTSSDRTDTSNAISTITDTSVYDRITDFDAFGTNRDQLDFSTLLDFRTNCTGSTVQQAFDQGYIFLVQQGSTAVVRVDLNGGAHTDTNNVFDVVHLENVQANDVVALRESLFLV